MTPDQIAEGKWLSAEFTPGKETPGQRKETPGSTSEFKATKAKAETGEFEQHKCQRRRRIQFGRHDANACSTASFFKQHKCTV